jgi:hypothetical protein
MAAKDVGVFAPPTVRSLEQVAVAKYLADTLIVGDVTFTTLLLYMM